MQKGNSNMNALLTVLVVVAVVWLIWYYETHGSINILQLLGF
jgi:uncharacterized membrane-anchored protein